MKAISALLRDRKRSQRGSVLSGVLIITAFLAVISGALMTELSGNFLLSRTLMTRVANEATLNSSVELAMNQLGSSSIGAGCPGLASLNINGRTAVPSYLSCWPTVRRGESQFVPVATGPARFNLDASHAVITALGLNDYIVGDAGGTVHDYPFGTAGGWTVPLGGAITAPVTAMVDASDPTDVSTLVPVSQPTAGAGGCDSTQSCVALLSGRAGTRPNLLCYMLASNQVVSAPAAGRNFPGVTYFGDAVGTLYAYSSTESDACDQQATAPSRDGDDGVVAGPVVFPRTVKKSSTDEVYAVVSDGGASYLIHDSYGIQGNGNNSGPALTQAELPLRLPAPSAQGLAFDGSSRIAITFENGTVAVVQIQSDFLMSLSASTGLGTVISDPPTWCHCPGPADVIGVGGQDGRLYLMDPSLNALATLPAGGPAISTTPQSDGLGDWFFGADDGNLYEAQQPAGQATMAVVGSFVGPPDGPISSGPQVGGCPAGLCIYLGSSRTDYIVKLDARDVVITSCLSNSPPACSGDKPRLWASVEVGAAGSPRTAHVQAWSYYSP